MSLTHLTKIFRNFLGRAGLLRLQFEIAILAVFLAVGSEALRLGETRDALIEAHDQAADRLRSSAADLDPANYADSGSRPFPPDETRMIEEKARNRAKAFRRLAGWHRWQAWRYRFPLFSDASKYQGMTSLDIDMSIWMTELGAREKIERRLVDR